MGKNALTVTRRVTRKRSSGINKNIMKIKKRKITMSLNRYITTSSFLEMTHSRAKIKQSTGQLIKYLFLAKDLHHIW